MQLHVESSGSAAIEFREMLCALGLEQQRVAKLFGVKPRCVRRWRNGDGSVPCGVAIVLRLLDAGVVTVAQVEQAAVPVPARMNGSAKLKPPASLLGEPAPEAATLTDSGLTTAEKVCALTPMACRWPYGDPGDHRFYFCGNPVAEKPPYCEHHRAMAWRALQRRSIPIAIDSDPAPEAAYAGMVPHPSPYRRPGRDQVVRRLAP
jgi:hypothetical protein